MPTRFAELNLSTLCSEVDKMKAKHFAGGLDSTKTPKIFNIPGLLTTELQYHVLVLFPENSIDLI